MLLIYLPVTSSRIRYIFNTIFYYEYGINYNVTSDVNKFLNHKGEQINYSDKRFGDEFYIKASPLLSENFIEKKNVSVGKKNDTIILFPNDEQCDIGFDVFAAAFYMLSRYEEYLPFTPDQYGRYKASDSLAYKNNFLIIPVVDQWLMILKENLQQRFPSLVFKETTFKAIITYDVDVAYKFRGRSFIRNAGSSLKDVFKLNFKILINRYNILTDKVKDPWDTYDYLKEIITQNNLPSIFFFLVADSSENDRNLSYKNRVMNDLINTIKTFSDIGIHPSFKSSVLIKKIAEEKERLEHISEKKVTKSRQHFLKFTLPETYNALVAAGIKEDYSMGFPYEPGFRAGTSKLFYFYDLKNEKSSSLKIFPMTLMDSSFINSKLSQSEIIDTVSNLIKEIRAVNGAFISIWHNHTVSD
ncbi:MAG: polysaccharide deacetylase family protein, partial [Bacteroidota bacterium]|nr:polysaccharide deacetylase family protein [Bacteroidota bacterium]